MLFNAVSKAQRAQQESAAGAAKVGDWWVWREVERKVSGADCWQCSRQTYASYQHPSQFLPPQHA
jgi:hypothetical protein